MGNKLGRRRSVVDEKYTKPQGLYQHRDIDIEKLKKLILESKLAPCYPGDEDCNCDLEECPICFLSYPSLNRSRCCSKSICTECFLQLKMPNATRPTQCPFCKTSNYAVEYRGMKTKKEKNMEQIEEQQLIEAKIRMRQQELQEEEVKFHQRRVTSSIRTIASDEGNCTKPTGTDSNPADLNPSRDGELSVDLDDIMLMEAIWLSMQENRCNTDDSITSDVSYISETQRASTSAGGLASAIATLAEYQQAGGREYSTSSENNALSLRHSQRTIQSIQGQSTDIYHEFQSETRRTPDSRLSLDYLTEQESEDRYTSILFGSVLPESFEEQMKLAMTLSLAEAHAPLPIHRGLAP